MNRHFLARRIVAFAAPAVLAASVLACLPHSNWWWGADLPGFYPLLFRLGWPLLVLTGLAIVYWMSRRPQEATAPGAGAVPVEVGAPADLAVPVDLAVPAAAPTAEPTRRSALAFGILSAVAAGLLFQVARARHFLLGDGANLLERLARHDPPGSRSPIFDAIQPALLRTIEAVRGPGMSLNRAGFLSSLIGSLVTGLIVVILAGRRRNGAAGPGLAIGALVLTQPALQLFFGYPGPHAVFAGALILLLLLVAVRRPGEPGGGIVWPLAALLIVSIEVIGLFLRPHGVRFHPAASGTALADVLNETWLVAAPALLVLGALATHPAGRRALTAPGARPAIGVALVALTARLLLVTPLGAMRDWELFVGIGIGLTGWVAAALVALEFDPAAARSGARLVGIAVLLTGLFFLVPWVGLQAVASSGVDRHLSAIDATPKLRPEVAVHFHEAMGDRFLWIGQPYLAAQAYRRAFVTRPSFEDAWKSGQAYLACGRLEDAGGAFNECVKRRPADWRVWTDLGNTLIGLNQYARADSVLEKAISLNPRTAAPRIHLARSLALEDRLREARVMLESARALVDTTQAVAKDFGKLDVNLPK